MNRPSWDEYFLSIADLTSKRSNCIKRSVGCVIVSENKIISLGYNGTPRGVDNCFDGGCDRCKNKLVESGTNLDLCICLHAEENALLFSDFDKLNNASLYVNLFPCLSCSKKILQCNIKRVIYKENYKPDIQEKSMSLLKGNGVEIKQILI